MSDGGALDYEQLRITARPARVAVLVDADDPHWQTTYRVVCERLSMLWGGITGIVVPVSDGASVASPFWELALAFDPDVWVKFEYTHALLARVDADRYEDVLDSLMSGYAFDSPEGAEEMRSSVDRQLRNDDFMFDFSPLSLQLRRQIEANHGPARGPTGKVEYGHVSTGLWNLPRFGFSHVESLPIAGLRVLAPTFESLPAWCEPMLLGKLGALSPGDADKLQSLGVTVESVEIDEHLFPLLLEQVWGVDSVASIACGSAVATLRKTAAAVVASAPSQLSKWGCAHGRRLFTGDRDIAPVIVVGDTSDDLLLAHSLDRTIGAAIWIPMSALNSSAMGRGVRTAVSSWLWRQRSSSAFDRPATFTSRSLGHEALNEILDQQIWRHATSTPNGDVTVGDPVVPSAALPALVDSKHVGLSLDEPVLCRTLRRRLPTPVPLWAIGTSQIEVGWWVDVESPGLHLPARSSIARAAIEPADFEGAEIVRPSRTGLSYASTSMGFVPGGVPVEQTVCRPRLRLSNAQEIFEALASDRDIKVAVSDKGHFQAEAALLFGGAEGLLGAMSDTATRTLLRAWVGDRSPGLSAGRRNFLTYSDCAEVLLGHDRVSSLIQDLAQRKVLRRGLVQRCVRCRALRWYALEKVNDTFACERCLTHNQLSPEGIPGGPDSAELSFGLHEVVYQFLSHDGDIPQLALQKLREQSSKFSVAPEASFTQGNKTTELDILALVDGRIVVGEAKKTAKLDRTAANEVAMIKRVRNIAEALTAHQIVFASAVEWAEATKKRIEEGMVASNCELLVLENLSPLQSP